LSVNTLLVFDPKKGEEPEPVRGFGLLAERLGCLSFSVHDSLEENATDSSKPSTLSPAWSGQGVGSVESQTRVTLRFFPEDMTSSWTVIEGFQRQTYWQVPQLPDPGMAGEMIFKMGLPPLAEVPHA
jgi:hypothetical protein